MSFTVEENHIHAFGSGYDKILKTLAVRSVSVILAELISISFLLSVDQNCRILNRSLSIVLSTVIIVIV